jgi:membrane-associated phospholipid phosphatase
MTAMRQARDLGRLFRGEFSCGGTRAAQGCVTHRNRVVSIQRTVTAALLCLATAAPLRAQADTIARTNLFTWRDLAILEGFAILAVAAAPLDRRMAERFRDSTLQRNIKLRKTARFVRTVADPGSFLIGAGLYTYGRIAKDAKAADIGLHGTEALAVGHALGVVLKGIVGRARPYKNLENPHDYQLMRGFGRGASDYRSMPSGHTIAAFAAAAAVTSETSRWWPSTVWYIAPVMYGGAAATGISRMYNNKHWASDVITGAAIGTMAGVLVVRWHFSHPGNAIDRVLLGASIRETSSGWNSFSLQVLPLP